MSLFSFGNQLMLDSHNHFKRAPIPLSAMIVGNWYNFFINSSQNSSANLSGLGTLQFFGQPLVFLAHLSVCWSYVLSNWSFSSRLSSW